MPLLLLLLLSILPSTFTSECPPRCSAHVTLPCSFPSLDPCMERICRNLCQKDNDRKMIACMCRGSLEGAATRTCFCGPSKHPSPHANNVTIKSF